MALPDHSRLAEALLPAVLEAGRIEMGFFRQSVEVEHKLDCSPVTAADREAEAVIHEALKRFAPGIPVIAEEAVAAGDVPDIKDVFFLVDPLDGTKEFVAKRDEFTVNIGLVAAGRPQFGIVYAPAKSDLYMTLGPQKAFRAHFAPDAPSAKVDTSYLVALKSRTPIEGGWVGLDSHSHRNKEGVQFKGVPPLKQVMHLGSSLKFCIIARGEADVYVRNGPTSEWDTAAGEAILRAAGGRVTALDGQRLAYGKSSGKFINPGFIAWGR